MSVHWPWIKGERKEYVPCSMRIRTSFLEGLDAVLFLGVDDRVDWAGESVREGGLVASPIVVVKIFLLMCRKNEDV
jgi:hypothetical protein